MAGTASAGRDARWRAGERVRVRGDEWRIEGVERGDGCAALRLESLRAGSPKTLTILTPFDRPAHVDESLRVAVVSRRRCLHEIDRVLVESRCFGGLTQAARASIEVLPYQLEPALAMLRHAAARVLVADGVGLGKTIEAGLVIAEIVAGIESSRVLVLTPAGLREQWRQELGAHFGLASLLADSDWLRRTASERPADINPWAVPGIYVASHDLVKRPETLRALEDVTWDLVVVDEAHGVTTGTDRRAAVHRVACGAQRVMLLTATPPAGDPHEFAALCAVGCADSGEPAPVLFARSRSDVRPGAARRTRVVRVAPTAFEIGMHRALERYSDRICREAAARRDNRARLAAIVLRKRALSSAASLLVSLLRRIDLLRDARAFGPRQLALPLADEDPLDDGESIDALDALAAPGLSDMAKEVRWLRAIAEAARAAVRHESKLRWLLRLLRRIDEPVIVFTEYRDTLTWLERRILSTGRSLAVLHGGMDPAARSEVPAMLGAGARTLLATDAAAEGLNLHQRCRVVVHFELPWNPARLEQRAGRVDRIGQTARVHEIALVSNTTAERLVLEPLVRRLVRAQRTTCGSRMFVALTEARIADAVMTSVPLELDDGADPRPDDSHTLRIDLAREAAAEAARIATQRRMLQRSPSRATPARARTSSTAWATARRSRTFEYALTLIVAIHIESASGRRVHTGHLVIRVARRTPRGRPNAALRTLVSTIADAPLVRTAIDSHALTILEQLSPTAAAAHLKLQQRRDVISRLHESAAQRIVQLPLLGPSGDAPRRLVVAPSIIDDGRLVVRPSIVAVLAREPRPA